MNRPSFGDRVRIVAAPETEAGGFAGRVGEVWDESERSAAGPVIGDRGEDLAISVLFDATEDAVWFAPHLLRRVGRARPPSPRLLFVFFAALALAATTAIAGIGRTRIRSLTLVSAAPPCLPVHDYVTSGAYPYIDGRSTSAARANIALRRAVVDDERGYAGSARHYGAPTGVGIYQTAIDQDLTSASTVVVSALIPTLKLYPGGNDGQTWISATVDVRSGRAISLRQLLASPSLALPALVRDWKAELRHTNLWQNVAEDTATFTPSFTHYRYFALTPAGLAFGFGQEPAGSRFAATIPYHLVRPYLSQFGKHLVAGVRRPRSARSGGQGEPAWASLRPHPARVGTAWPTTCA